MPMMLLRKLRSFHGLPWRSRLAFPWVWLMLGLARFMIICLPFALTRRWLGGEHELKPWLHLLPVPADARARRIGELVRLAARYTPWTSNCFPQALVARTLLTLARQPHTVFFGLRRDAANGEMLAHAWVMSGRVPVVGGNCFGVYTVVGHFAWPLEQGA